MKKLLLLLPLLTILNVHATTPESLRNILPSKISLEDLDAPNDLNFRLQVDGNGHYMGIASFFYLGGTKPLASFVIDTRVGDGVIEWPRKYATLKNSGTVAVDIYYVLGETRIPIELPPNFNPENFGSIQKAHGVRTEDVMFRDMFAVNVGGVSLDFFTKHSQAPSDFNFDGNSDIIWHNRTTGAYEVWFMDGIKKLGAKPISPTPDASFQIQAVGDFNLDGNADILLRNVSNNAREVWLMDGYTRMSSRSLPMVQKEWQIQGVGDFNLDGKPDIVWRHNTLGANAIWFMDGTDRLERIGSTHLAAVPSQDWQIQGIGDFNSDGKDDIVWRNSRTGSNTVWFMDGTKGVGYGSLTAVPNQDWQIHAVADFSSDGMNDVLWFNIANGDNVVWLMNGIKGTGTIRPQRAENKDWSIVPKPAYPELSINPPIKVPTK